MRRAFSLTSLLFFPAVFLQALTWEASFPLVKGPTPISDSYYGYTYPSCGITSEGKGVAVWMSAIDYSTNYQLHVSIEGPGGWGPDQIVLQNMNGVKPMFGNIYAAAVSPEGDIGICAPVFEEEAISASFVGWNGSAWSFPVSLSGATDMITTPSLAINASGDIAAAWVISNELNIAGASIRRSGSWSAASGMVPEGGTVTTGPFVGMDSASEALAFWAMYFGEGFAAEAASENGSGWTDREALATAAPSIVSPQFSSTESGFSAACWVELNGDYWDVKAAAREEGAWSAPSQVTQITGSPPRSLQVSASYDGKAALVWHEMDGESVRLIGSVYSGASWSSPATIHTFATSYMQLEVRLAITDGGNCAVLAVGDGVVYGGSFSTASGWEWAGALSGEGEMCANPHIAANRTGDTFAVWETQSLDGTWSVQGLKGSL